MRLPAALALAALLVLPAAAPAFADRPITVVLPYSPGSPAEGYSRALGDHMARTLGQNVVVTNRDGGSGVVGMRSVAASSRVAVNFMPRGEFARMVPDEYASYARVLRELGVRAE